LYLVVIFPQYSREKNRCQPKDERKVFEKTERQSTAETIRNTVMLPKNPEKELRGAAVEFG